MDNSRQADESTDVVSDGSGRTGRRLHRISTVRRREGASLRGISRRVGVEVRKLKQQEQEGADLRLSDLYQWQEALQVPITDLLIETDDSLSAPVLKRARMVKLMKTVGSLLEHADNVRVERIATMLVEQLLEIMPELEGVCPWPTVGQRRSLDEQGRAADRCVGWDFGSVTTEQYI